MQTPSATVAAIAGVIASSIVVVVLTSMYEGLPRPTDVHKGPGHGADAKVGFPLTQ